MASSPYPRGSFVLPASFRRGTKLYDLAAGAPLVLIYSFGAMGRLTSLHHALAAFNLERIDFNGSVTILSQISLLVVALFFVVGLLLRPPPIARASGLMPRIAAIAGTYLSVGLLLFAPITAKGWVVSASLLLVLCGTAFAGYAIFYLGRSISIVAEARKLVTGGPYRLVRHPLYLGEQVAIAGGILQCLSPFALAVFAVQIGFQLYRMSCEENILAAAFPEYREYARRTWRILPGLY